MVRRVKIIERKQVFQQSIFRIEQTTLQHERFDGAMSEPIVRVSLERGDGVTAVIYDREREAVLLIEQFRYPTYGKGDGWLLELPAGMLKPDEDPTEAMRRELVEETGCDTPDLTHVHTFFLSPGGSSERIFLYYAALTPSDCTGAGGGLDSEGEDIRSAWVTLPRLRAMLDAHEIQDAKTLIGLQWFLMQPRP